MNDSKMPKRIRINDEKVIINNEIFKFSEIRSCFFSKDKKCNDCNFKDNRYGTRRLIKHLSDCGYEVKEVSRKPQMARKSVVNFKKLISSSSSSNSSGFKSSSSNSSNSLSSCSSSSKSSSYKSSSSKSSSSNSSSSSSLVHQSNDKITSSINEIFSTHTSGEFKKFKASLPASVQEISNHDDNLRNDNKQNDIKEDGIKYGKIEHDDNEEENKVKDDNVKDDNKQLDEQEMTEDSSDEELEILYESGNDRSSKSSSSVQDDYEDQFEDGCVVINNCNE